MILDELDLKPLEKKIPQDQIKLLLAVLFWSWYEANLDRKVTTIKVWFIKKTLYVRDLEGVFSLIFGQPREPNST